MPKAEDRGERAILPSLFGKDKAENWEKRRKELGEILAGEEYGKIPPPLPFRAEILKTQEEFAGKGFMEWLSLHFEREEAAFSFPARLIFPKGERKFPFLVFANFSDAVPDRYFPAEEIIDHGFGVLSFCYQDVSADLDSFEQGAEKLFFSGDRAPSDFGKISLWAWAMSRLLDYLLQRGLADENRIAAIVFGIPAVKGVEFGEGFGAARLRGSENNDGFCVRDGKISTLTNHCGGILGGITNGMPLRFRAAVKPTPSIYRPQQSVNLETMEETTLQIQGRHDPCIVPRAVPVMEAAAAIAIYDALLGYQKERM